MAVNAGDMRSAAFTRFFFCFMQWGLVLSWAEEAEEEKQQVINGLRFAFVVIYNTILQHSSTNRWHKLPCRFIKTGNRIHAKSIVYNRTLNLTMSEACTCKSRIHSLGLLHNAILEAGASWLKVGEIPPPDDLKKEDTFLNHFHHWLVYFWSMMEFSGQKL